MTRVLRSATILVVISAVTSIAYAADTIQAGNGAVCIVAGGAGSIVTVPVFLKDVAGTPTGSDQPAAGDKPRNLSFQITFTPSSAVTDCNADCLFTRAGILGGYTAGQIQADSITPTGPS